VVGEKRSGFFEGHFIDVPEVGITTGFGEPVP
jgi:hypothetical protein